MIGADLLFQGEFVADGKPAMKNRVVGNPREFAGYTYGYNHALWPSGCTTCKRSSRSSSSSARSPKSVELIALYDGPIAALALANCDGAVDRPAIDTHGLRFGKLMDYRDVNFLPGGAKYGDLPGILSLALPAQAVDCR